MLRRYYFKQKTLLIRFLSPLLFKNRRLLIEERLHMVTGCRVKYRWWWSTMRQSPHKIGPSSSNEILIRHSLPNSSRVSWCTKKLYHATTIQVLLIDFKLPHRNRSIQIYHKSTLEKSAFFKGTLCCKSTTQYPQVDRRKTTSEWCRCLCSTNQTHPWIVDSGLTRCKL